MALARRRLQPWVSGAPRHQTPDVGWARVDERRLITPRNFPEPVVVRFDDAYMWSYHPHRDAEEHRDGWVMHWPDAVQPHLVGTTRVSIGALDSSEMCFDQTVTFAGSAEPLQLCDADGNPAAVDKWGKLTRVFADTDSPLIDQMLVGTHQAINDLRTLVGVDAHLNYGALLGAVREGELIGHDSDADLVYLSRYTHPADISNESFRMERILRQHGWKIVRMSAADLKLYYPLKDGSEAHIDVFGAFYVGDTFYLLGDTSGDLPRDVITPLGTVQLYDHEFAAPAKPEAMLEFLYGESWRVPDPSFSRQWPEEGIKRLDGWLRGPRRNIKEWSSLIATGTVPRSASSFATHVDRLVPNGETIVDLGCGQGRDSIFFARLGRDVIAYDYTGIALRRTRRKLQRRLTDPLVRPLVLNDLRSVLLAGAELARRDQPHHLYARHLVDSIDDNARKSMWRLASMALRRGGSLHLEFASGDPTKLPAPAPAHLRARVDAGLVRRELLDAGFTIVTESTGPGSDTFDQPDPSVTRIEARRATTAHHDCTEGRS